MSASFYTGYFTGYEENGSCSQAISFTAPRGTTHLNISYSGTHTGYFCELPGSTDTRFDTKRVPARSSCSYTAYSSYDSTLYSQPGGGTSDTGSRVNWILNNKRGESQTLNPTAMDIQYCIWNLLVPGYSVSALTPDGAQLLSNANIIWLELCSRIFSNGDNRALPGGVNPNANGQVPENLIVEYHFLCSFSEV